MMTPRCGETDDGNMSPNYALYNGKPKWDKNYLIYTFDSSVKPEVLEKLGPAVQQGFEEWIKHTQFTFAEGRPSSTFDIVIGYYRGWHGDDQPFDGPGKDFLLMLFHQLWEKCTLMPMRTGALINQMVIKLTWYRWPHTKLDTFLDFNIVQM